MREAHCASIECAAVQKGRYNQKSARLLTYMLFFTGANVNMLEGKGYSALFLAARYGYVESTRALVNGGNLCELYIFLLHVQW